MSREDDPSASGPDRQQPDPGDDPTTGPVGDDTPAWIPGQGRHAGPPHGPVVPGQRTALHRRGPFPAPRRDEPAGTGAPGTGPPDPAAPGALPAPVRTTPATGPPDPAASGAAPAPGAADPDPARPGHDDPGRSPDPAGTGAPAMSGAPDLPAALSDAGGSGIEHQRAEPPGDDGPSDAYLADRVRDGDDAAYEVLYQRHVDAVRRLARLCTRTRDNAEDLVGETFTRTLHALRSGHGPREACRPYLLTTVRRVAGDWARNERRVLLTDDVAAYESGPGGEPEDPAVAATDRNLAARAFKELPERWQAVLWYTEVEREPRDRVAPLLGVSPNALSKLKERARDGLREAYLRVYVENGLPKECRPFAKNYGAYVRHKLGDRAEDNVRAHLDECDRCRAACLELASVSTCMRVVAEGLLGAAALAYLAAAAAAAAAVGAAVGAGAGAAGAGAAGSGTAGAGAAGSGAAGSGAAGGGSGGTAAAQGGQTLLKSGLIAGATIAAIAAVAWAFVANNEDGPKKPVAAPTPAPAASAVQQPPPSPPAPPPPPPAPPAAPSPAPPPPPKPEPPKAPPPKPTPEPPRPTPPASVTPPAAPAPPKPTPPKAPPPKPPKPLKPPYVTIEPTRIVVDNGKVRVECGGTPAGKSGMPRCEHVTITLPSRPPNPNRPSAAPQPTSGCREFGMPGTPKVTICRK